MKYTDLSINLGFHKNMQETNWLKLFPKWWSENDPLLQAIGQEIAYLKAQAIFGLLNTTIKPPVMIWQSSICHKEYIVEENIKKIPEVIALPATLYKTFGKIVLTNNTLDDIKKLKIGFTSDDYIIIHDIIQRNDIVTIDITSGEVKINKKIATISKYGDGISYFKTSQYNFDLEPTVYKDVNGKNITLSFDNIPEDYDGSVKVSISNGEKSTEIFDGKYQEEIDLGSYKYPRNPLSISFYGSELYNNIIVNDKSKIIQRIQPKNVPLHNEAIKIFFDKLNDIENVDIDVKIILENAVFINEQNIEVHGVELIPINEIKLYAKYDFPYNPESNGWRQVYKKKYDENTNVIHDMITTHFYTKNFYVEVYYKGLDYPYKVGFPCYKDADKSSMYHVNERLDEWGEYFGLKRRDYKKNIPDQDLPYTFPQFYPFDIEQDFWYYSRLINEYAWNDKAINEVDVIDTNGDPVLRLHSIDPFIQDFVVYANSTYPVEREKIDYDIFIPNYVNQKDFEATYKRMPYFETQNLLRDDNNKAHVTLLNKAGTNISSQSYISKALELFFDLKDLPEDVYIDDISVIVEAEATDNNTDKYSNSETGIIIPSITGNNIIPTYITQEINFTNIKNISFYAKSNGESFAVSIGNFVRNYTLSNQWTKYTFDTTQITGNATLKFLVDNSLGNFVDIAKITYLQKENTSIQNLILNSDFENGLNNWTTSTDDSKYIIHNYHTNNSYIRMFPIVLDKNIFSMQQSTNYQMEETEIVYNLTDTLEEIKKKYSSAIDNNVIQQAIIKIFGGQQKSYILIPFTLQENDDIVDDITEVYVTYEDYGTYEGVYHNDEKQGRYIKVYLPEIIPNDTLYKESLDLNTSIKMSIACKTENHSSFIANNIILKTRIVNDEGENVDNEPMNRLKLLQVYGPYQNDELKTLYFEDVWHTGDIRNGLQKDGIYFVNVFENDNETNTPAIFLKNVRLRIDYSEKKNSFDLHTQISHNDLTEPAIAKLNIEIENTGSKNLETQIDIVHATNIKLSQTYFDVNLIPGQSDKYSVDIIPEYPIYDGEYDILTVCEDKVCENSVIISADGLIKTGVLLDEYYGQYNESITINASVTNAGGLNINDDVSKILFFIDGFKVGESLVVNNNASIIITPSNNKYLDPGIHTIEARFSGNYKFASSRTQRSLLISKNNTHIDVEALDTVIYDKSYSITANIYSVNNDNDTILVDEGSVSFYLDDELIGTSECHNGIATWSTTNIRYDAKEYTLTVKYNGTENYAQNSITKVINIIGGDTLVKVFDVDAKPDDVITLKAKVTNVKNRPLSQGYINFTISDSNETIFTSPNIEIEKGLGSVEYHIDANILQYESSDTVKTYNINVNYVDTQNIYQDGHGIGTLYIERGTVVISGANVFFGSQYEPLGFYFNIKDALTNEPVNEGSISVSIPLLNITCSNVNIDDDGGVRIIHNPINFTADEFSQLLKFHLATGDLLPYIDSNGDASTVDDEGNEITSWDKDKLYRIYDGDLNDLNLMDFSIEYDDDHNGFLKYEIKDENSNSIGEENIFIDENGYLYARTNIDFNRIYKYSGTFDVNIQYTSSAKYKNQSKRASIQLNQPAIDIDIHSQNITYNDTTKGIICYVTQYNLTTDPTTELVNDGKIYFFIDGNRVGESNIVNGMGVLKSDDLINIKYGHHLLSTEYISETKPITYTYADIVLNPIPSRIHGVLNRQFKGEKSKLTVYVCIPEIYDIPITGDIEVYLDDVLVGSAYLFGFEDLVGNVSYDETPTEHYLSTVSVDFFIDMPDDIDIEKHIITLKYLGDEHILPDNEDIILHDAPLPVSFDVDTVYVAKGNNCHLQFNLTSIDEGYINDGEIALFKGNDNLVAKGYVRNNIATINWVVNENSSSEPYLYNVKYINGTNYTTPEEPIVQPIYVIEPKDDVYIAQNDDYIPDDYDIPYNIGLVEASQCVKNGGNIHILDDITIIEDTILYQDINIIGGNNVKITKDLPNLLTDEDSTIQIYSFDNFNEDIFEIVGLTKDYLNKKDFHIIDNNIFFVQDNILVPIFLLTDGKFYSYKQLSLSTVVSNVSLTFYGETSINNIHFTSADSTNINDLVIYAKNIFSIKKGIIDKEITIHNQNYIQINNSFVYGNIVGSNNYNLDNNWWGSNQEPNYDTNNHIILKIVPAVDPPIIGDDISIKVQMIGANTISYDLPPATFYFEAETGYFSIPTGKTIDGIAQTTYFDGVSECTIYCTVDNETVSLDILDYNRKTEVILDEAIDIPIGYQIPICAKVQSVADVYYKFDDDNKIVEQSNNINNGYVKFYMNDKQIGRAIVIDGEAELPVYFSELQYPIINNKVEQYTYDLYAEYIPDDYYFKSSNKKTINLIDQNKVCFVSPKININGDGTFNNPYDSIGQAINSNKKTIYLKPGEYQDNNIIVTGDQNIKGYNGECVFKNNTQSIFNGSSNATLNLNGLTFKNNESPYIINDIGTVNIYGCVFLDNSCTKLINENVVAKIQYSVFVDNIGEIQNYKNGYKLEYCWFGTNTPKEDIPELENKNIRYVVMDFVSSKEVLYLGAIAHLTATLKNYCYDGNIYPLENPLPLRITKFETTYGSLMPIKDYTHDNKTVTFLDTNDESVNDKIILKIPKNNNYINTPVSLQCYVNNLYDEGLNTGTVSFNIVEKQITLTSEVQDGVATVNLDIPFDRGEYTLECIYENYKAISTFTVDIPYLSVQDFNLEQNDYVYDLVFNMSVIDVFNNNNINQKVHIFIDDTFIAEEYINNGMLATHLYYNNIDIGKHTLKITTEELNSEYAVFEYTKEFNTTKKNTHIRFDYTGLPADEPTDLAIYVYDDNERLVNTGNISVLYDNEIVYVNDWSRYVREETNNINIELQNGFAMIYGFYSEKDQHSIVIQYHANDSVYNNCIYTNNNFNVGLEEVIIESPELLNQLSVDIGKIFTLQFPIKDKYNNMVKRGEVSLYLDYAQQSLNENPLIVDNGYIYFEGSLPLETKAVVHDFIITYTDPSKKYLPTTYYGKINVHPIQTQIIINTIYTGPNTIAKVKYDIESEYGLVKTGKLEAFYDEQLIGWADVSDVDTYINLNIPMLPADQNNHIINFKYNDDTKSYGTSEENINLIIVKPQVQIVPRISEYYPQKYFKYSVDIMDQNNNNIDIGSVTLYIDNVLTDTQSVHNGQVDIPLELDAVRDYQFEIVYEENNYYDKTSHLCTFSISNVSIYNIELDKTYSIPNTTMETTLTITTPDDINVTDGFVDFYLNNNKIDTYTVVEDTKYVKLHIPNLNAGIYDMEIKYYNSEIFKDNNFIFDFEIQKQDITLTTPTSIITPLNSMIDFDINIEEKVMGNLEFYLIPIDENIQGTPRFIGIESINNRNLINFEYKLPNNLEYNDNTQYKILIKFTGNEQYNVCDTYLDLIIEKETPQLNDFNYTDEIEYESYLSVHFKTMPNTAVYFYLDNNQIGHVDTNDVDDDGYLNFRYNLDNTYTPNTTHILKAQTKESSTLNEMNNEYNISITKSTPQLTVSTMEAYVGQEIILPTDIVNNKNLDITSGTLKYKINNQIIGECAPGEELHYQLDKTYSEEKEISVTYTSDSEYYNDFSDIITIELQKNVLHFKIDNYGPVTRGTSITENITLSSPTTQDFSDVTYNVMFEDTLVTTLPTINIKTSLPDKETYILKIDFTGNDMFYPVRNKIFELVNKNQELINLSDVNNLTDAFGLIANYGTINIDTDVEDVTVTNSKNITIIGNQHTMDNVEIINNGNLNISDLIFTNGTSSVITNNNILKINNCTFSDNSAQNGAAMYITNQNVSTEITNCIFTNNHASVYGGAIYSDRGNDVTIKSCQFRDNNYAKYHGSCIASSGNIYISHNIFYNNSDEYGDCEIFVINNTAEIEHNFFDGKIKSMHNSGNVIANLNYYGYNDIISIQNNNDNIDIDTWLISDYNILLKEPRPNYIERYVTPVINKYRNTLENEEHIYNNTISNIPILINDEEEVLGEEYDLGNRNAVLKIGQEIFQIGD